MVDKKKPKKRVQVESLRKAVAYVRSKTLSDIKQIRLLWARGYTDSEIREQLHIRFKQWRRRIRLMREMPADEEVISVARRYIREHSKTVARLETRMKQLQEIHDKSMEEINVYDRKIIDKKTRQPKAVYKRPRDMALAATVNRDLVLLDRELLRTNQELIAMKQRLGLIETYLPPVDEDAAFEDAQLINSPNLMKAWDKRKDYELERKKVNMLPNGANSPEQEPEEAVIARPNGHSSE